jgi:hypothetical protein
LSPGAVGCLGPTSREIYRHKVAGSFRLGPVVPAQRIPTEISSPGQSRPREPTAGIDAMHDRGRRIVTELTNEPLASHEGG